MNDNYRFIDDSSLEKINSNKTKISPSISTIGDGYGNYAITSYLIIEIEDGESVEGRNFRKLAKTNWFIYDYLFDIYEIEDYIQIVKTPIINFKTGEIIDKPGVFLSFDSPETLDDQLAEIYGLTVEEQELMKDSIKPWKDKLSLTADGLY